MALLPSTACQIEFFVKAYKDPVSLYLLYWLPAFFHLASLPLAYTCQTRWSWFLSVGLGIAALIWQIICLVMFFITPSWSDIVSAVNGSWTEVILGWLDIILIAAIISG